MKPVIFAAFAMVVAVVLLTITTTAEPGTKLEKLPFRVLTDNKTGCDYLETQRGITPRLNPNGTQVCDRKTANVNLPIYGAKF